jgi:membrane protein
VDCRPEDRHRNPLLRAFCYLRRLSDAYATHQCTLMACACAYCAVLSLVPLLVVAIAAFGYVVGGSQRALTEVAAAINAYVPIDIHFLKDTLAHVFEERGLVGLVGLVGLIYAAHQTFLAMQPAMNMIWVVPENRHWLQQRLIALGATLYTLVLLGADLAFSTFFAYLENRPEPFFASPLTEMALRVAVGAMPMLLTTFLFALLYRFLPARSVPWKAAILGAGVAALLWQLTKVGFSVFVSHVHSYDRLYGSFSGLVILVVWVYYSMAILLLGAEIAADYETTLHGPAAVEARVHSGADLFVATGTALRQAEAAEAASAESVSLQHDSMEPPSGGTT